MRVNLTKDNDFLVGSKYYYFNDSTMPRILQHAKNGMFVISAMRGGFPIGKSVEEFTPAEKGKYAADIKKTRDLEADIRAAGLGYISSLGGFIEKTDAGEIIDANEFSFIVPYNKAKMTRKEFIELAVSLAKKYNQESVLIAGIPEVANGQIRYLSPDEFVDIDWAKDLEPDYTKVNVYKELNTEERPYYTAPRKMGGRNFVFDSVSQRNISRIVGVHHVFGQYGWRKANTMNEIVLKK